MCIRDRDQEDLETAFRRKRLRFLGHIVQMDRSTLDKQIFNYIWQLYSLNGYTKQVKEKMINMGISLNDCVNRNTYRNKIQYLEVLCGETKTRKGWTCLLYTSGAI